MPLHSINPATGEVLRSVDTLHEEGLLARIGLAAHAAQQQRAAPVQQRTLALHKVAALLQDEREEIARTITLETGKLIRAARDEVAHCEQACRYYASKGARMLSPELLPESTGQAYVQWTPVGTVLVVLSGESPLWRGFEYALPLLLAGNSMLLKHAATVPQCALLLESLVRRAGFPRGALTTLIVEDRLVEAALHDDRVSGVIVCGSEEPCRALAAQAGWLLKRARLDLQGSNVLLLMPSADLEAAVAATIRAGALGESSLTRLIVHAAVYDSFAGLLVEAMEHLRIGNPLKEDTELGPMQTAEALLALEAQIQVAVKEGGRVLTGGTRLIGTGNFFEPTLLTGVPHGSAVARQVFTGPAVLLFRAPDLQSAIEIANSSPACFNASVWTRAPGEQQQCINALQASVIVLNSLPDEASLHTADGSQLFAYHRRPEHVRDWMQASTVMLA